LNGNETGWNFGLLATASWQTWGTDGKATARVIASADDYNLVHVRAEAGYRGDAHDHNHAELTYVLKGRILTNGRELGPGDGAAAEAGSRHETFEAVTAAEYLSMFRI